MRRVLWMMVCVLVLWGCDDDTGSGGDTCNPFEQLCTGDIRQVGDGSGGPDTSNGGTDTGTTTAQDTGTTTAQDTAGGVDTAVPRDTAGECGVGEIRGRVCTPNEAGWIGGALVELSGTDCRTGQPFSMDVVSDPDGRYDFSQVPSGRHDMHIQKGSFDVTYGVFVRPEQTLDITSGQDKTCLIDDSVNIAVVGGQFDAIEDIVGGLGLSYDFFDAWPGVSLVSDGEGLLLDAARLATYDIVMLNCGMQWENWSQHDAVLNNLRAYVEQGGNVYASDWFYTWIERAFPDAMDFYGDDAMHQAAWVGGQGQVVGTVLGSSLRQAIGQTQLNIDYPSLYWAVIESAPVSTEIEVSGTVLTAQGEALISVPLLVSFKPYLTGGTVLFTTFHNESQLTTEIERVLEHVIFSL